MSTYLGRTFKGKQNDIVLFYLMLILILFTKSTTHKNANKHRAKTYP